MLNDYVKELNRLLEVFKIFVLEGVVVLLDLPVVKKRTSLDFQ
jgi:hypothetical protein